MECNIDITNSELFDFNYYMFNKNLSEKAKCVLYLMNYYYKAGLFFTLSEAKRFIRAKLTTVIYELEINRYLIKIRKQTPEGYLYFYLVVLNNKDYHTILAKKEMFE